MNIYEIDERIKNILDGTDESYYDQNGEYSQELANKALEQLSVLKDYKIENIALYSKELGREIEAIEVEETSLKQRKEAKKNKKKRMDEYLISLLNADNRKKFETARVLVKIHTSERVELDKNIKLDDYWTITRTEKVANKIGIKNAIKMGEIIDGIKLVKKQSLIIK